MNILNGVLCVKPTINLFDLENRIRSSTLSYLDEFNNVCYNLNIFASTEPITNLNLIEFDLKNCSFNYFKMCVPKIETPTPPVFNKTTACQRLLSLDSLLPLDADCLFKFTFESRPQSIDYSLDFLNNYLDKTLLGVENSTDCLTLRFLNGSDRNSLLGLHRVNVMAKDKTGAVDNLQCSIYFTQSCTQRTHIFVPLELSTVEANLQSYLKLNNFFCNLI